MKARFRLESLDSIKSGLVDDNSRLSNGKAILTGMDAGLFESLLAVTTFETVKTALIEDGKRAHRRYCGLMHGCV